MGKELTEFHGTRKFKRLGRWSLLEETLITKNSKFAPFADNYGSDDPKLKLTIFRRGNLPFPYTKFVTLPNTIMLDDFTVLSKVDTEDGTYMEVNSAKDKIRLYKEVLSEG